MPFYLMYNRVLNLLAYRFIYVITITCLLYIAQVFAFGSVPLKTYLPDGDIDLTVLGNTSYDSTLVNDVSCILESEEQNTDAEFVVKDLERIDAEVHSPVYTSCTFLVIHFGWLFRQSMIL